MKSGRGTTAKERVVQEILLCLPSLLGRIIPLKWMRPLTISCFPSVEDDSQVNIVKAHHGA
jgi:hypothetical protein